MENTAEKINTETAASSEQTLSDEMIALIVEREQKIEQNPDAWVDSNEVFADMEKKLNVTL